MIPYEIQLPRNENEIRKYYIESKFSICDNLPIPHIQNLSNHAYVSLIDIIRNILKHGLPLDTIKNTLLNLTVNLKFTPGLNELSEQFQSMHTHF